MKAVFPDKEYPQIVARMEAVCSDKEYPQVIARMEAVCSDKEGSSPQQASMTEAVRMEVPTSFYRYSKLEWRPFARIFRQ